MLVASRLTGAAVVFLVIQRNVRPLLKMHRKDVLLLVLSSAIGVVGNQFLYVKGLSLTTAINATLISTTIPVFALLASIVFGYDQISLKRFFGMLLAASGVLYLVNPFRGDFSTQTTLGNILIVSNSFLYGTYIVISKDLFERYGALNVITWIFLVGTAVTLPVGLLAARNENLAALSSRRVGISSGDHPATYGGCLLSERMGTYQGSAEHCGGLHLSSTANCFWPCAGSAGRDVELANDRKFVIDLPWSCNCDETQSKSRSS
jgi:uncharacterized membrane protein